VRPTTSARSAASSGDGPTVISTFAGCGGSSLGYKLAGFRELLAVEWDDNAVETFRLNFPGVPVYHGDIAKLTGAECMRLAGIGHGDLDVLDGSPPCQGFSTAGKRRFDDPRNSLFREYARLLKELQPRLFVMENVTGMVKGYMKQAYLTIIQTLRDCGYRCKGEVLNAMYFNVPQSRERVIIIGVRDDLGIEPSHPKPQTRPVAFREIAPDALASRSQKINPWIPSSRPICTITKTPFDGIVKTSNGTRPLTAPELLAVGSFPDSFQFLGGLSNQWARIGNSVPPNLMRAIAEHVRLTILDTASASLTGGETVDHA
jgi:DNA (cytosine-5)-methyltransferase 1